MTKRQNGKNTTTKKHHTIRQKYKKTKTFYESGKVSDIIYNIDILWLWCNIS